MVKKHKYEIGESCIFLRKGRRNSILPDSYDGQGCYIVKKIPAEKWDDKDDPEYTVELFFWSTFAEYVELRELMHETSLPKYAGIHESELEEKIRRE